MSTTSTSVQLLLELLVSTNIFLQRNVSSYIDFSILVIWKFVFDKLSFRKIILVYIYVDPENPVGNHRMSQRCSRVI